MISDGQALLTSSFFASGLALCGGPSPGVGAPHAGVRPFPLQRPVAKGDQWTITVTNNDGARTITPELTFRFEEAYEPTEATYSLGSP
jgi:hypothetical protein